VAQEDVFLPTLTVRQTLGYYMALRCGPKLERSAQRNARDEEEEEGNYKGVARGVGWFDNDDDDHSDVDDAHYNGSRPDAVGVVVSLSARSVRGG
jgi:hypothetical protein